MQLDLTRFRDFVPLGRGAVVDVHAAVADFDGRAVEVCVKRVRSGQGGPFATRMFEAAHRAALVRSPHVARLHAYGATDHGCAFVVERVHGSSFRTLLESCVLRGERVPVDLAFHVALEIARGLSAGLAIGSHKSAIVHRGVSPAAVRIADDGRVVLSEFSMGAMFPLDEELRLRMTAGLGHYLSPEHFIPQGVEPTADVYSLGAMLYEMLAGHRPKRTPIHRGLPDGTARHLAKHRPDLPREITDLVEACLNLDRSARIANANDFARALAERGFRSLAPAAVSAFRASIVRPAPTSEPAPVGRAEPSPHRGETLFHGGAVAPEPQLAPISEAPRPRSVPPATMLFGGTGHGAAPLVRSARSPWSSEAAPPPPSSCSSEAAQPASSPWPSEAAQPAPTPWSSGAAQPAASLRYEEAAQPERALSSAIAVSDGQTAYYIEPAALPPPPPFVSASAFGTAREAPRSGLANTPANTAEARPVANRPASPARTARELSVGWIFALAAIAGFALVMVASLVLRAAR